MFWNKAKGIKVNIDKVAFITSIGNKEKGRIFEERCISVFNVLHLRSDAQVETTIYIANVVDLRLETKLLALSLHELY